jgi:hypothetical protein
MNNMKCTEAATSAIRKCYVFGDHSFELHCQDEKRVRQIVRREMRREGCNSMRIIYNN